MDEQGLKNIIAGMSLDEKVGSLFTMGFAGTVIRQHVIDAITKYHCAGLRVSPQFRTFGAYKDPKTGKPILSTGGNIAFGRTEEGGKAAFRAGLPPSCINRPSEYTALLDELQTVARARKTGMPLHFSFDQEGGQSADFNFGGAKLFPKPMGIRATDDPAMAYEVGKASGRECRALGLHWMHSPVLDVGSEPKNPEVYIRAYSDDPEVVAEYAVKTCEGLKEAKIIATGKHFPGRGHSDKDAHFEVPIIDVDKETFYARELLPYRELIKRNLLPSIMIAHSVFPAVDDTDIATVSKKIITGLLRDEMHYDGVITSDSISMGGVITRYGIEDACAMCLAAGADIILLKLEEPVEMVKGILAKVKEYIEDGRLPEEEVDKKILRQLKMKDAYDILEPRKEEDPDEIIHDPVIVDLAKEVAEKSVMVVRNEENAFPLDTDASDILLIEQMTGWRPNDMHYHPGILWKNMVRINPRVNYYEAAPAYDEGDIETLREVIKKFDTIVITNYFNRGRLPSTERIKDIITAEGKKVVLIANSPYDWTLPSYAKNVILSFATTPETVRVVAEVLFGKREAKGHWPLTKTPIPS